MARFQVENNIRLVLDGPVAPTDTQIAVQRATAPDKEPTAPTGGDRLHLTLVDNFGLPSVTEVVNVTGVTDNGDHLLLTVERGQENTSAASFPQGFVFQAATAGVIDSKIDLDDAQAHFDRTDNPHNVTKAQVGLSDVDNVSAADLRDRTTHTGEQSISTVTGLQGALDGKANLVGGKVPVSELPAITVSSTHVVADLTARDALTVEEGDVAIVQNTGSGEPASFIYDGAQWQELLTPVDGVTNVSASGSLHSTGGTTPEITLKDSGVTEAKIEDGAVTNAKLAGSIDPAKVAGTAVVDSDARLSDERTPLDGSVTTAKIDAAGIDPASVTGTAVVDSDSRLSEGGANDQTIRSLGTGATQALPGDYDIAGQAPVQSVAGKTGDIALDTDDVSEATANKYFTDTRAVTAIETNPISSITVQSSFTLPVGDTASRPEQPAQGMMRFNSQTGVFEGFDGNGWVEFIASFNFTGDLELLAGTEDLETGFGVFDLMDASTA